MQRITTASKRSLAMNYRCCCAIVRSEQTHTLATIFTSNRLTLHSYRHATNYACSHAITCNELPLLLRPRACNELQLLLRLRAVRKNPHAGEVRLRFEAITCNEFPLQAMNYSCCCAIVRSEKTHTLVLFVCVCVGVVVVVVVVVVVAVVVV